MQCRSEYHIQTSGDTKTEPSKTGNIKKLVILEIVFQIVQFSNDRDYSYRALSLLLVKSWILRIPDIALEIKVKRLVWLLTGRFIFIKLFVYIKYGEANVLFGCQSVLCSKKPEAKIFKNVLVLIHQKF